MIARWGHIDPKAELYFSITPYAYAANTPVNTIDPDGHLVIFVAGQNTGNGASINNTTKMKLNITAVLFAIIYNVINFLFWLHMSSMPNGTSIVYIFIYPLFWIGTLIAIAVLSFKNRISWFSKTYRTSTIIALFFCTPLPFIWVKAIAAPSTYCASTGFSTKDGYTIKYESWAYSTGGLNVVKYWKANEPNCNDCDSSHFKPDGIWVYLSKNKDTLKIDTYKDGKLIKERKK